MTFAFSSVASLIGAPIAGALLERNPTKGGQEKVDFIGIQVWSGACMLAGSAILCLLWTMTVRKQKKGVFI